MPGDHNFEHLPLPLQYRGPALLKGGGSRSKQTKANKASPQMHSASLTASAQSLTANWQARKAQRQEQEGPMIPEGIPILLQVDPNFNLDELREKFLFEIVAEQEEGYVLVASEDIEITLFLKMVREFSDTVHGSARIAEIHKLFGEPERLRHILSERLFAEWSTLSDDQIYIVDIGVACTGTQEIPNKPTTRGKRDSDADWERKAQEWSHARSDAYTAWDELKVEREDKIMEFVRFYEAELLDIADGAPFESGVLPDSFTVRLKILGKGLKDIVLNYPYVFEVVEPEDISLPQREIEEGTEALAGVELLPPDSDAPAVCVIDSGIQEEHVLLQHAIDVKESYCLLPGHNANDVGDFVRPGGHGTRVAGAILYGETIPENGTQQLPFWIQNVRVLEDNGGMPTRLFPPYAIRAAVTRYYHSHHSTRIFNHSINANGFCRMRYMSSWAAEIDMLSFEFDVLIVQSAGNLSISAGSPQVGIRDHLAAGRNYPDYLYEASARIASPAQSLQALTVGSVGYGLLTDGDWTTFAQERGHPSAFSRSGPGIWNVIKPEVVEFGGDDLRTMHVPPDVQKGGRIPESCPELVRSTMFPPGPVFDRDDTGTSFAAPKVARIAARLQHVLPDEPALLYRGLIVQSARWPAWAELLLTKLRQPYLEAEQRKHLLDQTSQVIRCIGYGLPDETRATVNTDHRTTLITSGKTPIGAGECHIYQVPIPDELRQQADEFDIRIDVTLSYVAQPRRTRRNLRHYLSTWVDWKSSNLGEGLNDFRARAIKQEENENNTLPGETLPWSLHANPKHGHIRDVKRNSGTVQKDWAVVKSNKLPDNFCIAVVGHQGWSRDPDSTAQYTLAVTFEVLGQEIPLYEPLRTAVIELQEIEAEAEAEMEVNE